MYVVSLDFYMKFKIGACMMWHALYVVGIGANVDEVCEFTQVSISYR